jgi:hypothetical protein
LCGAATAHDGPYIDDPVTLGDLIAIVDVGTHVEREAIDLHALAELEIAVSVSPTEHAVLSPLAAHPKGTQQAGGA